MSWGELNEAWDALAAVTAEHSQGNGEGALRIMERYGIDADEAANIGALYGAVAVKQAGGDVDELVLAFAGTYAAGVMHGLRVAETRAKGGEGA